MLAISLLSTPALMLLFVVLSGWPRLPLLLALGLTSLSITPVIMALVQETSPQNRALANGTYMSLSFVIRSGVVVIVGAMADLWGMRLSFMACAFITLLGLPFLLLLPKQQH